MSEAEVKRIGSLAYRESLPDGQAKPSPVLCLHGFPETSLMWEGVLAAATDAGYRALALDFPGSGRSPANPPATWERQMDAVERFVTDLDLPPVVLVVHDWGGLIGLRWACEHPEHIAALVISDTGFFADGNWHGMAEGLRTPETGEQMLASLDRDAFGQMMAAISPGLAPEAIDEYWLSFGTPEGQGAVLEMYRSGDFEKLAPYDGELGRLGVPTLILWGGSDEFAPVGGAHRLHHQIPGSEIHVIEEAGHFLYSDAPEESAAAVADFVGRL